MANCKHHDICGRDGYEVSKGENLCILHSRNPDKSKEDFYKALVAHREKYGDHFRRFVFPGDAVFKDHEFTGRTGLSDAARAIAISCTREELLLLAMYIGIADFRNVTFMGGADFYGATFAKAVSFKGATFTGEALFLNTKFTENADFSKATFTKGANFARATFVQRAKFGDSTFIESASFFEAKFTGNAVFNKATLSKDTNFREAIFLDRAYFAFATFANGVAFNDATFAEEVRFFGAKFIKEAFFGASFAKGADFRNVRFTEGANFNGARLSGRTIFSSAREGDVFAPIAFGHDVNFTNVIVEPADAIIFRDADLRKWRFLGTDLRKAEFTNVEWTKRGGRVGVWDEIASMPRFETRKWSHIERLYRQLKQNHEDQREHGTASDFHYGEKEMRRMNPNASWGLWFWLTLYWLVSGYGERWVRPLIWASGLLVGCAVLYIWLGLHPKGGPTLAWTSFWDWLRSAFYSFRVMTLLRPDDLVPIGYAKLVHAFQSLAGPLLVGLFALAVRQRLKR